MCLKNIPSKIIKGIPMCMSRKLRRDSELRKALAIVYVSVFHIFVKHRRQGTQ